MTVLSRVVGFSTLDSAGPRKRTIGELQTRLTSNADIACCYVKACIAIVFGVLTYHLVLYSGEAGEDEEASNNGGRQPPPAPDVREAGPRR